jgi:protease-4
MMQRGVLIFFSLMLFVSSLFFMVGSCSNSLFQQADTSYSGGETLGLVRIEGPIMDPTATLKSLRAMQKEPMVAGVLLRINSPGGAVGASQEIMEEVKRLREYGKTVVASFGNVAASGGLYSALSAEKIFANPGTLTGSIGVISQFPQGHELLKKLGVGMVTVKSGDLKDAGSLYREPSTKDIALMQNIIDVTYKQFVGAILDNRPLMNPDTLAIYADGRVLSGLEAKRIGLVDSLGGYWDAVAYLAKETGVEVPEELWEMREPRPLVEELLGQPLNTVPQEWLNNVAQDWLPQGRIMYLMP